MRRRRSATRKKKCRALWNTTIRFRGGRTTLCIIIESLVGVGGGGGYYVEEEEEEEEVRREKINDVHYGTQSDSEEVGLHFFARRDNIFHGRAVRRGARFDFAGLRGGPAGGFLRVYTYIRTYLGSVWRARVRRGIDRATVGVGWDSASYYPA